MTISPVLRGWPRRSGGGDSRARELRVFHAAVAAVVVVWGLFGLWLVSNEGMTSWTRGVVSDLSFIVAPLVAAAACRHAARRGDSRPLGWGLLGVAMLVWAAGSAAWAFYGVVLGRPAPFPSLADVGYLGYSVPAMAALLVLGTARAGRIARVRLLLDGAVIAAGALFLSWALVLDAIRDDGQLAGLTGLVQIAYPCVDVAVASMVLVLGSRQPAGARLRWVLMGGGLLTLTVTDSTYVVRTFDGSYASGGLLDLGWTVAFLLVALAALAPPARPATGAALPHSEVSLVQDCLPYLPVLAAVAVSIGTLDQLGNDFAQGDYVRMTLAVTMFALVLARQLAMLLENRALNRGLEQRAEEMRHLALHDPLTDLANRTLFGDRLEHALARAARSREPLAVLFLDPDRFKAVNDSLGHAAGDELLLQVADRLAGCLRPADTLARLGGDEFAVLLEDLSQDSSGAAVADRLLEALQAPVTAGGAALVVQASIGVAVSTIGRETAGELLRNADLAMYSAKTKGRGRYAEFEPAMHASSLGALEMEADLRRGLRDGEFLLHYQPLTSVQNGQLSGVEALVRWQHPERGMVSPTQFIPVAEATGLIVPLGLWVLQQACQQMSSWRRRYPGQPELTLAVNLSGAQLLPGLVGTVEQVLVDTGLPPTALVLEVTESLLMAETPTMISILSDLRTLGVRLAIDDFGTGYSSLNRLSSLPVDILKIDKSFIDGVGTERTAGVVAGMISMAHSLDLAVVAEGVEEGDQLAFLRQHGCDEMQGFLLARPMAPAGVEHLLAHPSARRPALPAPTAEPFPALPTEVPAMTGQGSGHHVLFYGDDEELLQHLRTYVLKGLADAGHCIVIATPEHREALRAALPPHPLRAAESAGRFQTLDAEQTLALFMRGGLPDPELFEQTVGTTVRDHATGGNFLHAYGEMVAVLWKQGSIVGALQLEELWNELQHHVAFTLLCAYAVQDSHFTPSEALTQVCDRHTTARTGRHRDTRGHPLDDHDAVGGEGARPPAAVR